MSKAKQLYDLQLIDLDIDASKEALASVECQLGETEELITARETHEEAGRRVAALDDQGKKLEWQIEDLQAKIAPMEAKLYSGMVKNPKELAGMQQDVNSLKSHKRELEDDTLEVMAELEEAEADQRAKQAGFAAVESEWQRSQEELRAEQARLQGELAQLGVSRAAVVQHIDAASLRDYEILRPLRRGLAVAVIERGMCQGCRISLPTTEVQRVRSSSELIHCSSCGRILYLS